MTEVPEGLKVKVTHYRRVSGGLMTNSEWRHRGIQPLPTGGATTVKLIDSKGLTIVSAGAMCSNSDTYSRRLGRTIALGRALARLK